MIQQTRQAETKPASPSGGSGLVVGQFFIGLVGLAVVLGLLTLGFFYLRGVKTASLLSAIIAIIWGVGGVAALFVTANYLIESSQIKPVIPAGLSYFSCPVSVFCFCF